MEMRCLVTVVDQLPTAGNGLVVLPLLDVRPQDPPIEPFGDTVRVLRPDGSSAWFEARFALVRRRLADGQVESHVAQQLLHATADDVPRGSQVLVQAATCAALLGEAGADRLCRSLRPGFWSWVASVPAALLYPSPRPPLWRYSLGAWPCALLPAWAIALLATLVVAFAGFDPDALMPNPGVPDLDWFVGAVIIAPIVETALLLLLLRFLQFLDVPDAWAAAVAGVSWGVLHGLVAPLWFFGPAWAFFVFSWAALFWRRVSWWHAFAAATVPHALINATVGVVLRVLHAPSPAA